MGIEIPPRFARGLCPAGHGDRLERPKPLVTPVVGEQELAAPQRVVAAPSQAIECDAKNRGGFERIAVFGKARSNVGMMMLTRGKFSGSDGTALFWRLNREISNLLLSAAKTLAEAVPSD